MENPTALFGSSRGRSLGWKLHPWLPELQRRDDRVSEWYILACCTEKRQKTLCTIDIFSYAYTVGKIIIEHVSIFLSKYIYKGAVDLKFSPDVGNNPSNPYVQRFQIDLFSPLYIWHHCVHFSALIYSCFMKMKWMYYFVNNCFFNLYS